MPNVLELPRGVNPETGLLVATSSMTGPNATIVYDTIRFDIGPGYAVGIDGVTVDADVPSVTDGEQTIQGITTNPDQAATGGAALYGVSSTIIVKWKHYNITTSGAAEADGHAEIWFPVPLFTVQNVQAWAASDANLSGDVMYTKVFYRIYSVPEDFFIRIAGISLSRG